MIPDYQSIMLPLLSAISDGQTYKFRAVIELLANQYNLSETEREELLPSGTQPLFDNRVGWANTYLKKAGLIQSEKRGYLSITKEGLEVLKSKPEKINVAFLRQYPSFNDFTNYKKSSNSSTKELEKVDSEDQTPEEMLEYAHQKLVQDLSQELLETIKSCTSRFFEKLVVDLLLAMGYGGSRLDAGQAIGKTNDGGIDGVIKEDKLGLDIIYLQAKRWENTVPIAQVRDFAGALLAKKAKKGVFISTSSFPKSAHEFVAQIEPKLILIDGAMLTKLMIEHNVGVSLQERYEIKRMDSDYFEQ